LPVGVNPTRRRRADDLVNPRTGVAQRRATAYTGRVAKLLVLFTVVPLAELSLLLLIDDLIGLWPTVAMVLTTGIVGAWLARMEGLRVLREWRRSLVRGKVPEEGVLGGVLVLVGGVLLITPGVLTDLAGLLLLIPPTRRFVANRVRAALARRLDDGTIRFVSVAGHPDFDVAPAAADSGPPNVVMDVEPDAVEPDDEDRNEGASRRVLH
jgi:UPF0716 protein FxsA